MLGPERKSHILSKKEKEITAYHEAGHALVALGPCRMPTRCTRFPSSPAAAPRGYTLKSAARRPQAAVAARNSSTIIAMSLGGYVAEKMVFGDVTTGPSNDLQVSTALARDMVTKYGMSDKLGAIAFEGAGGRALFGQGVEEQGIFGKVVGARSMPKSPAS